MCASLSLLPFDLVEYIAGYLNVRDYNSLSCTSKKFNHDLKSDGLAKKCFETSLSHSRQVRDAFQHAGVFGFRERLSHLFSRGEALRQASPYSATLLANAESFVYEDGIVSYSTLSGSKREVRILDLLNPNQIEKVISSQFLAQKVVDLDDPTPCELQSLTITGLKHSIITIVCDFGPGKGSYLFAINVTDDKTSRRTFLCERLRSTNKIFVRHNASYLYYGTHSATGTLGYREWLIQGFDLPAGKPLTQLPVQLRDFAGSDLHSVVDFTIFNDEFYAITNQTSFESEEINWTSYFCYVRFLAGSTEPDVKLRIIWRRQDDEGPINDAWTNISLQIDIATGELLIVEIRKEWPKGISSQYRTCYIEPWEKALHGNWSDRASANLTDPLAKAIDKDDRPRYEANAPVRIPKYTHPEFGEGFQGERYEYLNSKTKWSSYSYAINAFVDLVVDDVEVEGSWRPKEKIRLRVASRKTKSPLTKNKMLRLRQTQNNGLPIDGSEEAYKKAKVLKWSPLGVSLPEELEEMMCPGGRAGDTKAVLDDKGIVYMCGAADGNGQRALVYLSFDPGFGFEGMKRLDGSLARPRRRKYVPQAPLSATDGHGVSSPDQTQKRKLSDLLHGESQGHENDKGSDAPAKCMKGEAGCTASQELDVHPSRDAGVTPQLPSRISQSHKSETTMAIPDQPPKERLLYKTKATYLRLQQGWWLRTYPPRAPLGQVVTTSAV